MRSITQNAVNAFNQAKSFKSGNTIIEVKENVTIMYLFGNAIAYKYNNPENTLSITNAGWKSNTTKERLNALDGVSINQKNGVWYLNGKEWDGKLIDIDTPTTPTTETTQTTETAPLSERAIFKNEIFNNFANLLLNNGFTIVIPEKTDYWNYLLFEKNGNLGNCQLSTNKAGISFSTVHKPNSFCGTGFGLDDSYLGVINPTIEDAEKAFIKFPNWATKKDINHVVKYNGLEDYFSTPINKITEKTVISPIKK